MSVLFSSQYNFLNPVRPASTRSAYTRERYSPALRTDWTEPTMRRLQPFVDRYLQGAAFSGGLAGAGELAGQAIGQTVLNRAFSLAQGGSRLAPYGQAVARRMALGPGEVGAGVLGNIGHLIGAGLGISLGSQPVTSDPMELLRRIGLIPRQEQEFRPAVRPSPQLFTRPKPSKPISMEPVRAIAQKTIQSQLRRTRTPAAGGSRAF